MNPNQYISNRKKTRTYLAEALKLALGQMVTTSTISVSSGQKKAMGESGDAIKLWTKLWVSSAYGGKKHFPEDYERIEMANLVKTKSFKKLLVSL